MVPSCPLLHFPSLTFNKLHYTHVSCHGFFHMGHKEFGNLITDCTIAINNSSSMLHKDWHLGANEYSIISQQFYICNHITFWCGDGPQGLLNAEHVLYPWAPSPAAITFDPQNKPERNTLSSRWWKWGVGRAGCDLRLATHLVRCTGLKSGLLGRQSSLLLKKGTR
jgi:hypothetical protein